MARIAALLLLIALGATIRAEAMAETPPCGPQACAMPIATP